MDGKILTSWLSRYEELGHSLPIYRVIFAVWLLVDVVPRGLWLRDAPSALMFPPPGLPLLLGSVPAPWLVSLSSVVLTVLSALLVVGWRERWVSIGIVVTLLGINTSMYSFGKIDHDILMVAVPLFLAFSGWGNRHPSVCRPAGWWTGVLALSISLSMFSSALIKVLTGWLDPSRSASRLHFLHNHYVNGRSGPLTEVVLGVDAPWVWMLSDYATVLVEVSFPFLLLSPRLFRVALAAGCIFHFGTWLLMDITFPHNIIAYGAFVPWVTLFPQRLQTPFHPAQLQGSGRAWAGEAVIIGLLVGLSSVTIGNPFTILQELLLGNVIVPQLITVAGFIISAGFILSRLARRALSIPASGA